METNVEIGTVDQFYQYVSDLSLNKETGEKNEHDKKNPLTTLKGTWFEVFCLFYLKINPEFENLFEWVMLYEDVDPQLKGRLGLPEKDKGTDIVAKWKTHHEEERKNYVCIQCKFRTNKNYTFNKTELGTFFADYRVTAGGMFMTNCFSYVDIEGEDKHPVQCIQVVNKNFNEFEKENPGLMFEILNNTWKYFGNHSLPLNKITRENNSRKYQEECFVKAEEHFKENNRGILQSPTGTGKTFEQKIIVYEVVRKILKKPVQTMAFFAPKIVLLKQTAKSYYSEENEVIIICSEQEKTAGRNVFVTTKAEEIQERLNKRDPKKNLFVFITYASSQHFVSTLKNMEGEEGKKEEENKPIFDFFVFDECHHLTGNKRNKLPSFITKNDFHALTEKMLFLTATPKNVIGKQVVSMDNEEIFGKMFYHLSLYEAICIGALCDYNIRIPISSTIKLKRLRTLIDLNEEFFHQNETTVEQGVKETDPIEVGWRILMVAGTIIEAFQKGRRKIIAFASNKNRCKEINRMISQYFEKINKVKEKENKKKFYGNCILSDETNCNTHNKREKIFREFTSNQYDYTLLCSVRILTEGYDAPECDGVCLCDPISSKTTIMQMIGRGMRKNGEKTLEVLIPVVLREGEEFGDSAWIKGGDFHTVRNVLVEVNKEDARIFDEVVLKESPKFTLNELNIEGEALKETGRMERKEEEQEELEFFSLAKMEEWKTRLVEGEELRETPEDRLKRYIDFVRREKRIPKWPQKKVNEMGKEEHDENLLYSFGSAYIKTDKVRLTGEERNLLVEHGFNFEKKETPEERLKKYIDFVQVKKRLPKQSYKKVDDRNEEEKIEDSIYNFGLTYIKIGKVKLTEEERYLLVEEGFNFENRKRILKSPHERLKDYIRFVKDNERLPKVCRKKADDMNEEEKKEHLLCVFGRNIKSGKVELTEEERALLTGRGFDFKVKERVNRTPNDIRLNSYIQFVIDNKRLPKVCKKNADDMNEEEKNEHLLYNFGLTYIKIGKVKLTEEERYLLVEEGFNFEKSITEPLDIRLNSYIQFVIDNKRLPKVCRKKADDMNEEEKIENSLYHFGYNNIKSGKVKLTEEERVLLTGREFDFKEKRRVNRTPIDIRLNSYIQFVIDNKRLPKVCNKKANEMEKEEYEEHLLYAFGFNNIKSGKVELTEGERALLIEKGFDFNKRKMPDEGVKRYIQFIQKEERLPKCSQKKVSERGKEEYEEHLLYNWGLKNIKTGKVQLTEEERALLLKYNFVFN